jgi:long-chain acyl-CoA synthetase
LEDLAASLGKPSNLTHEQLCADPDMVKEVLKSLQEYGRKIKLDKFELPGALKLIPEKWTPDSGLVTAAFKLKRKPIQDKYQPLINEMYATN